MPAAAERRARPTRVSGGGTALAALVWGTGELGSSPPPPPRVASSAANGTAEVRPGGFSWGRGGAAGRPGAVDAYVGRGRGGRGRGGPGRGRRRPGRPRRRRGPGRTGLAKEPPSGARAPGGEGGPPPHLPRLRPRLHRPGQPGAGAAPLQPRVPRARTRLGRGTPTPPAMRARAAPRETRAAAGARDIAQAHASRADHRLLKHTEPLPLH